MKLFCYVYEDEYEGLDGIETLFVNDFSSLGKLKKLRAEL